MAPDTPTASGRGSVIPRVPYETYAALPGVRISALKELSKSPLHYRHRLEHPRKTKPLALGAAAHCATLEPAAFHDRYTAWTRRSEKTGNLCPRNGQHWDKFQEENAGKEIITQDDFCDALNIGAAVRSDKRAMRYLASGNPEVTLQWSIESASMLRPEPITVDCKVRIDWLAQLKRPVLAELKTAAEIEAIRFGNACARYGYHLQLAWGHDAYEAITGIPPDVVLIAVESYPPHDVVVYRVPEDVILQGREEYQALLRRLVDCQLSGEWNGIADGNEQELTLPSWLYGGSAEDDLSELGLEVA